MKDRNILNSPRLTELRHKRRQAKKKKIMLFFVIFVVVFSCLALISRISSIQIKEVMALNNKVIESSDIENFVKEKISGNYLWIFPKTNFIIYPKKKIEDGLKEKFKRIKDVSISDTDTKTLEISISEYNGKYLWCGQVVPPLRSNLEDNKCYFLDDDGYVFDEAPYFSGNVYFKFYGFTDNNEKIIGSHYLQKDFKRLIVFKENLEKMNLNPESFWNIPHETGDEGSFSISGDPIFSPYIIFNMSSDYEKLAENLQSALDTEPLRTDIVKKISSLQYLDLRFGNKVYYKFK